MDLCDLCRSFIDFVEGDAKFWFLAHVFNFNQFQSISFTNLNQYFSKFQMLFDSLQLVQFGPYPGFKWYPLYGEIFGNQAADPSAETIRKVLRTTRMSPAILPGGFSEAVYTNADPTVEYNYIGDRMGFVRLAIEHGVDIIPTYSKLNFELNF